MSSSLLNNSFVGGNVQTFSNTTNGSSLTTYKSDCVFDSVSQNGVCVYENADKIYYSWIFNGNVTMQDRLLPGFIGRENETGNAIKAYNPVVSTYENKWIIMSTCQYTLNGRLTMGLMIWYSPDNMGSFSTNKVVSYPSGANLYGRLLVATNYNFFIFAQYTQTSVDYLPITLNPLSTRTRNLVRTAVPLSVTSAVAFIPNTIFFSAVVNNRVYVYYVYYSDPIRYEIYVSNGLVTKDIKYTDGTQESDPKLVFSVGVNRMMMCVWVNNFTYYASITTLFRVPLNNLPWTTPLAIGKTGSTPSLYDLSIDTNGNVLFAYFNSENTGYSIRFRRYSFATNQWSSEAGIYNASEVFNLSCAITSANIFILLSSNLSVVQGARNYLISIPVSSAPAYSGGPTFAKTSLMTTKYFEDTNIHPAATYHDMGDVYYDKSQNMLISKENASISFKHHEANSTLLKNSPFDLPQYNGIKSISNVMLQNLTN